MVRGRPEADHQVFIFIVCIFFSLAILGCDSNRILNPEEKLEWKTYTTADGLSYNIVDDLAVDSRDRIWIATFRGINVFDGVKWDTLNSSDGLPFEYAEVLHFDKQGNLWIGKRANGNGLIKYDGTTVTTFTTADGLSDNNIQSIASQDDGTIWVGTFYGGVCRYDGIKWVCFDTQYVNHRTVYSIYVENDRSIWFSTADGVTHYDGLKWTKYLRRFETEPNPLGYYYFKQIHSIGFDRLYVGWFGFNYGVYKYEYGVFKIIKFDDYEYVTVNDVSVDSLSGVWFTTYSRGIYYYRNGAWNNYTVGDGLPDNYVTSVVVDSKGVIWFGTGEGLTRLQLR
ncbi:MAG: Two-component system sensor histidine kinase [candidate division Zixibacteria bacterium RBG-1]|nr:MAG: Two-component system sensor histidine kinase [candidate division Zixibacteria bacterium RBG-1]OGC85500.1 MAG: hypothetical protein A2V73_06410 [candidate division Zixibacteria bacterium RBG_19FT_COMBO_42_43]